ncbi:hypothetical protein [Hymenobacter fodinae]|uniref:Outer membrane protein beta-barrel domain-containing protein n=1 Tax=Hymenobacter fodinae TaxID=2510796 RepID=A0A4Z0P2P5_9BACT|nr:hypothetical protein [Hymenobacter fodinae]TGE05633.1 hypothetical protein EU556_20255 [Hymenobacter fodinae]
MKKLTFSILLLGLVSGAKAQTGAGHYLISGLINYNSSKTDNSPNTNSQNIKSQYVQFIPTVGYFVADNLAIGLSGNIASSKQTQASNSYGYTTNSVGPFVRYYKMVTEKLGFYGQLEGNYVSGTNYTTSETVNGQNTSSRRTRGGSGTLTPGIVFFPIEKLGLQLGIGNIGYYRTKETPKSPVPVNTWSTTSSYFSTNFGLAYLNLGASLHLGGK